MSDNDIKIYEGSKSVNISSAVMSTFEAMNFHRENGNLQKAKDLGAHLAELSPTDDDARDGKGIDLISGLPQRFRSQTIVYQIKVLLVFAAETLLQSEIRDDILATTAINAMHDKIREDMPVFFKNISSSAAFTFYCLALKKRGDVTENIGEAFAMMCDVQKNTESFVNAGKSVWEKAVEGLKSEISKVDFVRA